MKSLKTPLRYPGGKSRATKYILNHLPNTIAEIQEFRDPFLGGGSMSFAMTKRYPGLRIWVNDLYEPLVNFYQVVQQNGQEIENFLLEKKSENDTPEKAKTLFLDSKEILQQELATFERGAAFYVVNKCSFSGLTESSSFSAQASVSNFSVNNIKKLSKFSDLMPDWKITNLSYENLLEGTDQTTLIYLDPPYDIKPKLYGKGGNMHRHFDHDLFYQNAAACKSPCMVSYNSSNLLKDRFNEWKALEYDLTYTMRSVGDYMKEQKDRKELLLLNY